MSSTDADTSHPLPPPPPPPRPRNRPSASATFRRFTHCIFTRPQHPATRWYLTFLHEGTYSEVYIGHPYPAAASPPVAIKVGKEAGAGGTSEEEMRRMLHDEGRILQQLQSSQSVCRLYHQPSSSDEPLDYTDADDRRAPQPPFIAMTLLLCDVSQLRREARLTRPAMWEVFVLMLRAMRGVHEGRVLHRDVKPSNFGLAHTDWSSALSGAASSPSSPSFAPPNPRRLTAAVRLHNRLWPVHPSLHPSLLLPSRSCRPHSALPHLFQGQVPLRLHHSPRGQTPRPLRRPHHASLHRAGLPAAAARPAVEEHTRQALRLGRRSWAGGHTEAQAGVARAVEEGRATERQQ